MLISLLIPKNMQIFSQFYRLVSKIVFFSSKIYKVYFPLGKPLPGPVPARPERLGNIPDHLALEAKVKIGPLSGSILTFAIII